jgi:hypothetical protein
MRRTLSPLAKALLVVLGVVAAGDAMAARSSAASDAAARRPSNSFNLYAVPPPGESTVVLPTPGTGIASGRTVITDPYKVPLIQNAGTLTPGR